MTVKLHNKKQIDKNLSYMLPEKRLINIRKKLNKNKTVVKITKKCLTFRKSVV